MEIVRPCVFDGSMDVAFFPVRGAAVIFVVSPVFLSPKVLISMTPVFVFMLAVVGLMVLLMSAGRLSAFLMDPAPSFCHL